MLVAQLGKCQTIKSWFYTFIPFKLDSNRSLLACCNYKSLFYFLRSRDSGQWLIPAGTRYWEILRASPTTQHGRPRPEESGPHQGLPGEGDQQGAEEPGEPPGAGRLPPLHWETSPAGRGGQDLSQTVWQVLLWSSGQHPTTQRTLEPTGVYLGQQTWEFKTSCLGEGYVVSSIQNNRGENVGRLLRCKQL